MRPATAYSLHACFQITEQSLKGCSVSGMLVPITEIANMSCAANVSRPRLGSFHDGFIDPDRKKHHPIVTFLPFACGVHFTFHPATLHRGLGQNEHYLVIDPNRFFNAFLKTVPYLQVFWREPAPHPFSL